MEQALQLLLSPLFVGSLANYILLFYGLGLRLQRLILLYRLSQSFLDSLDVETFQVLVLLGDLKILPYVPQL